MKTATTTILAVLFALGSPTVQARLNVITTITDLKSITEQVGGDLISVEAISKGTQDPHYIEAKPSFMVKLSRADLVVAVGLDLEVGWLPSIQRGARNPGIMPGNDGYLEVGPSMHPLDIPSADVTRADGDVHPMGNPHFWLDPIRAGEAAQMIAARLARLDAEHASRYLANAKSLQNRLQQKTRDWQERIEKSGVKKIVTYHKTLTYFFDRFHLDNPAILEPKPGIPPTSGHIIKVIELIRSQNIPLILVENYFDSTVTKRIKQDAPSVRTETVAVSVEGANGIKNIEDLYEALVRAVEGK